MSDMEITIKSLKIQLATVSQQLQHQTFKREKTQIQLESLRGRVTQQIKQYRNQLAGNTRKGEERETEIIENGKLKERVQVLEEEKGRLGQALKEAGEHLKGEKKGYQKNEALMQQRIEFQQQEINQLRNKNEELTRSCQKYMQASQVDHSQIQLTYYNKLQQAEFKHEQKLLYAQQQHSKAQKQQQKQNNLLLEKIQELELSLSLEKKKALEAVSTQNQQLKAAQLNYQNLLKRLNNADSEHVEATHQKDVYYQKRIAALEGELEEVRERAANDLQEATTKSEAALEELKQYGEQERNQLQRRVRQESEKITRRLREQEDDLNHQWSQQRQNYEARLQEMQERMEQMQEEWKQQVETMKCDHSIEMQKVTQGNNEDKIELKKTVALLQQKLDLTTNTLQQQLTTQQQQHQRSLETIKQQLVTQYEQQLLLQKQRGEELTRKIEQLTKNNHKGQQTNLKLKAEMDNEKVRYKEKEKDSKQYIQQLQEKLTLEMRRNSQAETMLTQQHTVEIRKLNQQIERMRNVQASIEQQRIQIQADYESQNRNLQNKLRIKQEKLKRSKDDHQDLLRKFETTVKSFAANTKIHQKQAEFDDKVKRIKQQYNDKMKEKQELIEQERNQNKQKIYRLQTDNKQLRDKVILLEARQSMQHQKQQQSRYFQPQLKQGDSRHHVDEHSRQEFSNVEINKTANKEYEPMKRTLVLDRSQNSLNTSALTERDEQGPLQERRSTYNHNPSNPRKTTMKMQGGKWGRPSVEEGVRPYCPN